MMNRQSGFTLFEILFVLAVACVIMFITIDSGHVMYEDAKVERTMKETAGFARQASMSVARGGSVTNVEDLASMYSKDAADMKKNVYGNDNQIVTATDKLITTSSVMPGSEGTDIITEGSSVMVPLGVHKGNKIEASHVVDYGLASAEKYTRKELCRQSCRMNGCGATCKADCVNLGECTAYMNHCSAPNCN